MKVHNFYEGASSNISNVLEMLQTFLRLPEILSVKHAHLWLIRRHASLLRTRFLTRHATLVTRQHGWMLKDLEYAGSKTFPVKQLNYGFV